eukprot:CAMPEP_0172772180 /NCGR_PEP_ID=MMETSP1074-20121228/191871_1 /TAXON_ID=2916 /ORGANISM="Ceratium fusus, Strain PA161109" /LENGTH=479 /DNA_ID=CAMNT_0013608239 /DNA_START=51 /DNA_END=1490 /DNA_ORIENTATION=-
MAALVVAASKPSLLSAGWHGTALGACPAAASDAGCQVAAQELLAGRTRRPPSIATGWAAMASAPGVGLQVRMAARRKKRGKGGASVEPLSRHVEVAEEPGDVLPVWQKGRLAVDDDEGTFRELPDEPGEALPEWRHGGLITDQDSETVSLPSEEPGTNLEMDVSSEHEISAACEMASTLERPAVYVVATPIGNLGDITLRAMHVLRYADVIFAEDTRVTRSLLHCLDIPLNGRYINSCHEFNEEKAALSMSGCLRDGKCVALVSDAGTPLVSDPGFAALRRVREEFGGNALIRPVPGPCAAITALSVAGVPATKFLFAGFLSTKPETKKKQVYELLQQARTGSTATLVLYEAPHRIMSTLETLASVLEEEGTAAERKVVLCRELTKRFETVLSGSAQELVTLLTENEQQKRGEFVILVESGSKAKIAKSDSRPGLMAPADVVRLLSAELPAGKAAYLTAKICGGSSKDFKKVLAKDIST